MCVNFVTGGVILDILFNIFLVIEELVRQGVKAGKREGQVNQQIGQWVSETWRESRPQILGYDGTREQGPGLLSIGLKLI
jgi:hypothetical protein